MPVVPFFRRFARARLAALLAVAFLAAGLVAAAPGDALAKGTLAVTIDLSAQRMQVSLDGRPTYSWAVSTARPGYRTPTGRFHPIRLERIWHSTIYDSAPMPWSIFFHGGYAIHGTYEIRSLGRPVSHGCVRLRPGNARALFGLVQRYGAANTVITIVR